MPNNRRFSFQIFFILVLFSLFFYSCSSTPQARRIMPHNVSYYETELNLKYPGSDFRKVDDAVLHLRSEKEESLKTLVDALRGIALTDWEKARAVYIWITHHISYDIKGYLSGDNLSGDYIDAFNNRKSICQGYAELYVFLANELGLDAFIITGYAKGYGFVDGSFVEGTNHAWVGINIDGKIHLFDPTWGAGYVRNKHFSFVYCEFYFDTDPNELIYSHFIEGSDLQVLSEPIDRVTFFNLPNLAALEFSYQFPTENLMERAIKGESLSIPEIYDCKQDYRLIEIPISSTLEAGKVYTFIIEAEQKEIMINNSGDSNIISKGADFFTIERSFRKGDLSFYLYDPSAGNYSGMFRYTVE